MSSAKVSSNFNRYLPNTLSTSALLSPPPFHPGCLIANSESHLWPHWRSS